MFSDPKIFENFLFPYQKTRDYDTVTLFLCIITNVVYKDLSLSMGLSKIDVGKVQRIEGEEGE
jgi:hypothetical protein